MSDANGELDFNDLTPIEITIRFPEQFSKKYGCDPEYRLREPSEATSKKYQNFQLKGSVLQDGKVSRALDGAADIEPVIVADCLFARNKKLPADAEPVFDLPVSQHVIERWPARVVGPLFERVKEIGDLDGRDTPEKLERLIVRLQKRLDELRGRDPAKNELSATPITSG